jgi:hypothetical protein
MKTKTLVLALIKDDLINTKIINSLNNIGLAADDYQLHASTTIMTLMKIKSAPLLWEEIHDTYIEMKKRVEGIDIQESPWLVDGLAEEIYGFLKAHQKR